MKRLAFSLLLLAALTSVVAQNRPGEALFHRFDKDGDGTVTAAELPDAAVRARFDKDGDGDVTLSEFRSEEPSNSAEENLKEAETSQAVARLETAIEAMDSNGDGALSREETNGAEWFGRVDRDGNGTLDVGEIDQVRKLVRRFGDRALPSEPNANVTPEEVAEITSGPKILNPGESGIGRRIEDAGFVTIDGAEHRIAEAKSYRGVVFAMTSATCPVSKRYLPTLAELATKGKEAGIPMVLVNAFASESEDEIREQLASLDAVDFLYVHDKDETLARALGATTTTEAFLLDSAQTLIYRGAVDDQYGIDYSVSEARRHFLREAIESLLEDRPVEIAATAAPGCELDIADLKGSSTASTEVTYHRDVARILQRNCVECHNEGGIAPFALDDFAEVDDRARVIRRVIEEGTMPPWFAADDGEEESPWANDRSLSEREKSDLLAWLESEDRPMGDPSEAPVPVSFPEGWTLGEPDLVVPLSRAYDIQATGFMPYQRDTVVTELTEDRWVTGYEILPSERDVVHHVIVNVSSPGESFRDRGEAAGYWAAYVPGNGAVRYPEGFARRLPAGAKIHFQIHYTPSGKAKKERLKLGLHFARETPRYEVKTIGVADRQLEIPAGAPAHVETTTRPVPFDIAAMGFMAHMHTRGAGFTYELIHADGTKEMLLDIPRYDFNWQLRYELKEPRILPKGSSVKVTGVFDNSEGNQANPDPAKTVRWGDQTVDEMLIGYIEYFVPVSSGEVVSAAP